MGDSLTTINEASIKITVQPTPNENPLKTCISVSKKLPSFQWGHFLGDSLLMSEHMGDMIKLIYIYINSMRIYIHILYIYIISFQCKQKVGVSCKLICHRKISSNFHRTVLRIYSHGGWLMAMLSLSDISHFEPTKTDPTHGTSRLTLVVLFFKFTSNRSAGKPWNSTSGLLEIIIVTNLFSSGVH